MAKIFLILFGGFVISVLSMASSYVGLHYGWGLEVVSWPMVLASWAFTFLLVCLQAGLELLKEALK